MLAEKSLKNALWATMIDWHQLNYEQMAWHYPSRSHCRRCLFLQVCRSAEPFCLPARRSGYIFIACVVADLRSQNIGIQLGSTKNAGLPMSDDKIIVGWKGILAPELLS
jgi:hypothetical protein